MSSSPETAPPGWEHHRPPSPSTAQSPRPRPPPASPPPPPPSPPPEMGQMVCGSCRSLLSYPCGAMHVQCPCCQILNFVLEAHQVGNVECGKCSVLLMYPYGSPAVRCSACHFVTKIGEHNLRPPASVLQGQSLSLRNPVH